MATNNYDFTTFSTGAVSAHADWGEGVTPATNEINIANNGGSNNVRNNGDTADESTVRILTSVGTYARKQGCGYTIGANPTDDFGVFGGLYIANAVATGYYFRLYDLADTVNGGGNRMYKSVAGAATNLNWMNNTVIDPSDLVWMVVDDDGSGNTDIDFYFNPSTFDGDGFPTNGLTTSHTDTTSPITSGQAGLIAYSISNSASYSYLTHLDTAGFTAAGGGGSAPIYANHLIKLQG